MPMISSSERNGNLNMYYDVGHSTVEIRSVEDERKTKVAAINE